MKSHKLNIPFYFKPLTKNDFKDHSIELPFTYKFNNEVGLLSQSPNEKVNYYLKKAYQIGSLFEGSLSNSSGDTYFEPFKNFISKNCSKKLKALEIGCGQGNLLRWMNSYFKDSIGIEPQPQKNELNNIVKDFFPSTKIDEDFDVIIHYGVLEHFEDPFIFLKNHIKHLKDNGTIICAVPNCESYIDDGDISMFFHEHFSYFSKSSLFSLFEYCGFEIEDYLIIHGMIFIKAIKSVFKNKPFRYDFDLKTFQRKFNKKNKTFKNFFKEFEESKIVFYPGLRALNYLNINNKRNCKLIDDSPQLVGKYLPMMNNPIMSLQNLNPEKISLIVITSKTFFSKMKDNIRSLPKFDRIEIQEF